MGNYSNSYTPNENLNFGYHQYKPSEIDKLNEKLQKIEKARILNLKFDEDNNINLNIKNNFYKKYGRYLGINRFAIPVIGIISSGKSTFLNNFLNLNNILQIGELVTTRFIAIIRHDKNADIPELYHVEIERRNNIFNFKEKGECFIKSKNELDIAKEIQKLNEDIEINNKQNSDKYLYDIEKYFLIIRTKIPLFEGELEEYGNLIDFLDIPGLDEVKNSANTNFDDFVKIIFPNILFPIFIIDYLKLDNDDSLNIIKKYFLLYTSNIRDLNYQNKENISYEKGFYLLNKIDLLNDKDNDLKNIFAKFKEKYDNLLLDNGKIINTQVQENKNFFAISANKLNLDKSGTFIDDILIDIESQAKISSKNSFKSFLKEYLESKYHIDLKKAKEEKEDDSLKEKLNIINEKLKKICSSLNNPKLTLKELTFLNKFNDIKVDKEKDIKNENMIFKILENTKKILDDYLNFNFEELLQKIDLNMLEEKKNLIKHYNNNNRNIKDFNNKVCSLFPKKIEDKYDSIKELIQSIKNFNTFYDNNNIRIIFIGMISSGKTSLLNTIIGHNYKILQTTISECTKCIYRIKYSKQINFCESKIVTNEYGHYFQDIKGTEICDLVKIKNKIKVLNDESKFKVYTLYIPIEGLEDFEFKEKIELIDLPGIKKEIAEIKIDLKELIEMCDGFIFNFNSLNIADENTQYIFTEIINDIKNKNNETFNFENCLFNLNFIDQIEDNLINEKVEEFKKNIVATINSKIYTGDFLEKLTLKSKILSSNNINVSFLSNLYYNQYQENVDTIVSLKFITNDKLEDIYENILEEYDEEEIEKLISKTETDNLFMKDLEKKISLIKQKTSDKNNEYILKISKFLVIFEKYKTKLIKKYESSKAEVFFKQFHNQIKLSHKNNKNNTSLRLDGFLINLLFKLFYYNELCFNEGNFDFNKKNIEIKKNIIEKEYNRIKEIINKKYLEKKIIIEDGFEKEAIEVLKEEKYHTVYEIKSRLIKLGYQEKLLKLFNLFYNNELKNIRLDFIYFCINEISDLLNVESLQNIISLVSTLFKEKDNTSLNKMGLISGVAVSASALGIWAGTAGGAVYALSIIGGFYAIIPFIAFGVTKYINWINDTNEFKVKDYFKRIKKEFEKIIKEFIKSIETKKNEFIEKLEKTNEISSEEIKALKEAKYLENFQNLIEELK